MKRVVLSSVLFASVLVAPSCVAIGTGSSSDSSDDAAPSDHELRGGVRTHGRLHHQCSELGPDRVGGRPLLGRLVRRGEDDEPRSVADPEVQERVVRLLPGHGLRQESDVGVPLAEELAERCGRDHEAVSDLHDVGFVVEEDGRRLGLAGDMGHVSKLVKTRLAGCHALVVESNYCPEMLLESSYPAAIRQRIDSRHGHLSNRDACSLLKSVLHDNLSLVVLTHISEQNNTPERVKTMAAQALNGHSAEIHVAWQDKPTQFFSLA